MRIRRYIKKHPTFDIEYDQQHMACLEQSLVVDAIQTHPNNFYGFVDETGDQFLAKDQKLFGMSGCAFIGQLDQQCLDAKWHDLRRKVFKVPDGKPYRSKKHLGKVKQHGIKQICCLLEETALTFFASVVTSRTMVAERADVVGHLLGNVGDIVAELMISPVESAEWYFDHSEKLLMDYISAPLQIRYPTAKSLGTSFLVRKSSLLPAMEIADLVNFVVGDRVRSGLKRHEFRHGALWEALFSNPAKGRFEETHVIEAPILVPPGS